MEGAQAQEEKIALEDDFAENGAITVCGSS